MIQIVCVSVCVCLGVHNSRDTERGGLDPKLSLITQCSVSRHETLTHKEPTVGLLTRDELIAACAHRCHCYNLRVTNQVPRYLTN